MQHEVIKAELKCGCVWVFYGLVIDDLVKMVVGVDGGLLDAYPMIDASAYADADFTPGVVTIGFAVSGQAAGGG